MNTNAEAALDRVDSLLIDAEMEEGRLYDLWMQESVRRQSPALLKYLECRHDNVKRRLDLLRAEKDNSTVNLGPKLNCAIWSSRNAFNYLVDWLYLYSEPGLLDGVDSQSETPSDETTKPPSAPESSDHAPQTSAQ